MRRAILLVKDLVSVPSPVPSAFHPSPGLLPLLYYQASRSSSTWEILSLSADPTLIIQLKWEVDGWASRTHFPLLPPEDEVRHPPILEVGDLQREDCAFPSSSGRENEQEKRPSREWAIWVDQGKYPFDADWHSYPSASVSQEPRQASQSSLSS